MESINANGAVLTIGLLKQLLSKVNANDVVCVRMHPVTAQAYEENPGSVHWPRLRPGQMLAPDVATTCGLPIVATLSQSEHFVDLMGCDGKAVGQISNLALAPLGWGADSILGFGNRGQLSYKTVAQQLAGESLTTK